MKSFCVEIIYRYGKSCFLTSANNGKEALLSLINYSSDYKQLLYKSHSDNMIIMVSSNEKTLKEVKNLMRK